MSEYTKNYGLEKPDYEDYYDVGVFNKNYDRLDEEIAAANVGLDELKAGKSDMGHTHETSDINDLSDVLSGKAELEHTHKLADITGIDALRTSYNTYDFIIAAADTTEKLKYTADYISGADAAVDINAAIGALPDSGGRILLLPGTYSVKGVIHINKPNTAIIGCGACTVLESTSSGWFNLVRENAVIRDLRLVGSSTASSANQAIIMFNGGQGYNAENAVIENCIIEAGENEVCSIGFTLARADYSRIINNSFICTDSSVPIGILPGAASVSKLIITGNAVQGSPKTISTEVFADCIIDGNINLTSETG